MWLTITFKPKKSYLLSRLIHKSFSRNMTLCGSISLEGITWLGAISRKMVTLVTTMLASLSRIKTNFAAKVLEQSKDDAVYRHLRQQVLNGIVWWYWLVNDFLLAKARRLYVSVERLRHQLQWEVHDGRWAGHPGRKRALALLARSYCWPMMEQEVEAYVKSCMVYELDKTERRKEVGLL